MSQFLDPNSQHLVAARFNANLVATTSHFADPSQFVTVVQQQQNTATQQYHNVANNFNFFQQPCNSMRQSHMDHQAVDQTCVDHNQQLTCVNSMNADNLSNHLANSSPFIFDQANGVLRIPHTSVLDASNAIVVNSITSSLRQHQMQQNQNYHQHGNSLPTERHVNRVNRPSRPLSPNKSGSATNQTSKTGNSSKSRCSRSRDGDTKKVQNSDPNRRTFACPTCGKGFTENFNMKRHMQIHSHSRPKFSCNECPKSFAWKDNFVRHKKAAHDNVIGSFPIP